MKKAFLGAALYLLGAGVGLVYVTAFPAPRAETLPAAPSPVASAPSEFCERHQLAEAACPWCTPSLVEALGHCGGHDVPEAFCSRCNEALIPGFKAEGDWCAGHGLPESQCLECGGRPTATASAAATPADEAAADPHRLPTPACPWCTPDLVSALGDCDEHGGELAFCTRCNAKLIPGFLAEDDWCADHALPESRCVPCRTSKETEEETQ